MIDRRFVVAVLLLFAACKPPQKPAPKGAPEPQIKATVVTIQTNIQPGNKSLSHVLVIAGDRARSLDEVDRWRLFDVAKKEVTFVDDIAKTSRTEALATLAAARRVADATPLPDGTPRAQLVVTNNRRPLQGVEAKQSVIKLGGYQRELWIGQHPLIPEGLFAMMTASRPALTDAREGIMSNVDAALLDVHGFPLADHAELPYGNEKMVVDRSVVKIEQKNVPAAWFAFPAPTKPAARPRSSS